MRFGEGHGELVAQIQVLDGELAVVAEEEGEKPKHVEQESDPHRAEMVAESRPPDQPVGSGRGSGDGQALHAQVTTPREAVTARQRRSGSSLLRSMSLRYHLGTPVSCCPADRNARTGRHR
jgi:hypothetical protein